MIPSLNSKIRNRLTAVVLAIIFFGTLLFPFGSTLAAPSINAPVGNNSQDQLQAANNAAGVNAQQALGYKPDLKAVAASDNLQVETGWRLTVYQWITGFGGLIAKLGGWLLDASLGLFVINMAATAKYIGLMTIIETLWTVVRDFFNLLFIFGLIWIGFQTILNSDDSGTKRLLGSLIVAALFINFSLFITQMIVDFSNIVAYQISKQISVPTHEETIFGTKAMRISDAFVAASAFQNFPKQSQSAVTKLFKTPVGGQTGLENVDVGAGVFLLGFVVMAMLIIMGFVFAAGAVILFTRFIALIIFMIFSPAMFLGFVFPKFGFVGDMWWKYFLNHAIVGRA